MNLALFQPCSFTEHRVLCCRACEMESLSWWQQRLLLHITVSVLTGAAIVALSPTAEQLSLWSLATTVQHILTEILTKRLKVKKSKTVNECRLATTETNYLSELCSQPEALCPCYLNTLESRPQNNLVHSWSRKEVWKFGKLNLSANHTWHLVGHCPLLPMLRSGPCGFRMRSGFSRPRKDWGIEGRGVVSVRAEESKWAFYLSPVPQPPGAEERPHKLKYSRVYTPD